MNIIDWFVFRFFSCKHVSTESRRWLDDNNTPLVWTRCKDCLKTIDRGHVHGDSEGWESDGWE